MSEKELTGDELYPDPKTMIDTSNLQPLANSHYGGENCMSRIMSEVNEIIDEQTTFTEAEFRKFVPLFSAKRRENMSPKELKVLAIEYSKRVSSRDIARIVDEDGNELCKIPPNFSDHVRIDNSNEACELTDTMHKFMRTHNPDNAFDNRLVASISMLDDLLITSSMRGDERLREIHDAYNSFASYLAGEEDVCDYVNVHMQIIEEHKRLEEEKSRAPEGDDINSMEFE